MRQKVYLLIGAMILLVLISGCSQKPQNSSMDNLSSESSITSTESISQAPNSNITYPTDFIGKTFDEVVKHYGQQYVPGEDNAMFISYNTEMHQVKFYFSFPAQWGEYGPMDLVTYVTITDGTVMKNLSLGMTLNEVKALFSNVHASYDGSEEGQLSWNFVTDINGYESIVYLDFDKDETLVKVSIKCQELFDQLG